ncbi:serine/threonine protein kinase [Catovirus CTV1]|uniref:Serine/threonine protein kinase n=1 Tax=Catovirus CTV1 TaxID=1977631 RepID=A0A1V0SAX3_9VIRU|nr:serine/threonine protein kinase [Catovirus CTV1]
MSLQQLSYRSNGYDLLNIDQCIESLSKMIKHNNNLFNNKTQFIKQAGLSIKFLGKGGQGIAYLLQSDKCGSVVIKISKINDETKNEIFFLNSVKNIVDKNICPHFVYNYENKIISNNYYFFNEYANGTLENWTEDEHSVEEWNSFLFQILYGIYVFQKKLKSFHADLKPKNILFKRIQKGFFKYIIENNEYYVPTCGYLFIISDFGKSQSILKNNNVMDNESILAHIKNNTDLENIEALPKRILVSAIEKKFSGSLVEFKKYVDQKNDDKFESYFLSEKRKIDVELSKYPDYIKNKMLLRSIIYYAIEKKYINVDNIEHNFFKMKYPPSIIVAKMENLLKKSINEQISNFLFYSERKTDILAEFKI